MTVRNEWPWDWCCGWSGHAVHAIAHGSDEALCGVSSKHWYAAPDEIKSCAACIDAAHAVMDEVAKSLEGGL